MMYAKLALRNMRRSIKDYVIYFVTITLTAALMYSFLSLGFADNIISMSENMSMLTTGIVALSVIVAFITSFVIAYAVRFILGQRKKEFAIYKLLGMHSKSIQLLFLIENSVTGTICFLCGTFFGTGLSGILVHIVNRIFRTPHTYQIFFSIKAFVITAFLFMVMYSIGIFRAAKIIRQRKIIDLFYDRYSHEKVRVTRISLCISLVVFSLFAITTGGILTYKGIINQTNTALLYFLSAVFLIVCGIYGIYCNVPFLILYFSKRHMQIKYNNANLFYFGQIGHRIWSAGHLMALTAILMTISLATMFVGLFTGAGYRANMEIYYPYDVGIAFDAPLVAKSMDLVIAFIEKQCPINDKLIYYLYTADNYQIEVLALSDYNHLRQMLGYDLVILKPDQFLVHCDTWNYMEEIENALNMQPEIIVADMKLTVANLPIQTEPMELYRMAGTKGYVIVVPDKVSGLLSADKIRVVLKLENGGFPELKNELQNFLNSKQWNPKLQAGKEMPDSVTMGITVKAWGIANSLTGFTTISFCGLYLSIVCLILSCTILAFEQLSKLDHDRYHYQILDKMGVSKEIQKQLIYKELSTFFFIPAILPIVVTIFLIVGAQVVYGKYLMQENLIGIYGIITVLLFILIYMVYFCATCFIYKRVVFY